jgi:Mn-containing catalase
VYFNMSNGDGDARGPWNQNSFDYRDPPRGETVDGDDGVPTVELDSDEQEACEAYAERTRSQDEGDPVTGAELVGSKRVQSKGKSGNGRPARH